MGGYLCHLNVDLGGPRRLDPPMPVDVIYGRNECVSSIRLF